MHPICMCNSLLLHACLFNCDLVRIYLMTATGIPFSSPSSSLAPYLHLSLASLFNVSLSHHYQQVQLSRDMANSLPCGLQARAAQQCAYVAMFSCGRFQAEALCTLPIACWQLVSSLLSPHHSALPPSIPACLPASLPLPPPLSMQGDS